MVAHVRRTEEPEWVNINQLVQMLGVSRRTIYRYMAEGMPAHRPPEPALRFRRDEIEAWLAERKTS
jgi:excisionase family DNA binding protein